MSNEFKAVPIEAFNRAIVMLSVAGNHCEDHAMSAISHYDDADCDGICINDDCKTVIEWLQQAHDGEVVYLIYHGDGECAVDEVSKADYDEHDGPKRILYTAPPRVVDDDLLKMLVRIRDDKTWRTNDNALWPDLLALIRKHEVALEKQ